MNILQNNAEVAVRDMLREIAAQTKSRSGTTTLHAEDYMDDGSKIQLSVDIDEEKVTGVLTSLSPLVSISP